MFFPATINMMSYGMAFGWPSPTLPKLQAPNSPIQITNSQGSWLSVMPFIGALIGAPLAAILSDKIGRKIVILSTAFPLIISWIMIGVCDSFTYLMISRVFCGVAGSALFTVVPSYIAEVTEPEIRGRLGAMLTWMWNLGVVIIYSAGPFVEIKTMAFISISIPLIFILLFSWMPESPYFFAMKNRSENAKLSLSIFRSGENSDEVDKLYKEILEQISENLNIVDIFTNALNRKTLVLILTIITIQEFSGRSPFLFYSQSIFQEADKNIPAIYISMIYALTQLLSAFISSFIVDKFGRKPLLLLSCIGSAICLIIQGTFFYLKYQLCYNLQDFKWLPVITLLSFVVIFTIGLGTVPMILAGEMFATNVKSNGLGIVDLYAAVISIVISKFFQIATDEVGIFLPFWAFAIVCVFGIGFIAKFLPETKGLSLEDIQNKLKL